MDLMWNDLSKQTRKVAAQTLGRTGRGREVHDEIYARLCSDKASDRVEALKIMAFIGIITIKLLEVLLRCFRDDYFSVREWACRVSQNLYEKNDERLIDALVFMVKYDKASKLRAMAIRSIYKCKINYVMVIVIFKTEIIKNNNFHI